MASPISQPDSEDDENEIAAAMGFSGFGGARTAKKRKFAHDTFVDGQDDASTAAKAKDKGSGANTMPLGVRERVVPLAQSDVGSGNGTAERDQELSGADADVVGREAMMTEKNSKRKKKRPVAAGLAGFLSRAQALPDKPPDAAKTDVVAAAPAPTAESSHVDAMIKDESSNAMVAASEVASQKHGHANPTTRQNRDQSNLDPGAYRRGVRNQNGDMVYFLPSFLEDPWKELKSAAAAQ